MHPATQELLRFFEYDHLPEHLQAVSAPFADLAMQGESGRLSGGAK